MRCLKSVQYFMTGVSIPFNMAKLRDLGGRIFFHQ